MQEQSNINRKEQNPKSDTAFRPSTGNANDEAVEAFKQAIEELDDNPEEC
ncbi:hypothetical protein [Ferviditalea candida]|uniref:Uncharacterized protein n=1 Tax=Ferviditalea candida TaxID=3108399 RepID=A0ABU5ZMC9_9BACL|nr:hypothetical protein [Paenibacillaceae bacterium T2]